VRAVARDAAARHSYPAALVAYARAGGFQEEHFEFFAVPPAQRAWVTKAEIDARLRGVWQTVFDTLTPAEARSFGEIHVNPLEPAGTIGSSACAGRDEMTATPGQATTG